MSRPRPKSRTAAGLWVEGSRLNLERALKVGDELGGHIVTGHVDGLGTIIGGGAGRRFDEARPISADAALAPFIAAKGSIALHGVSLTVNEVEPDGDGVRFTINLIPHTAAATTFGALEVGQTLNIEIDILARYLGRMMELRARSRPEHFPTRPEFGYMALADAGPASSWIALCPQPLPDRAGSARGHRSGRVDHIRTGTA